MASGDALVGVRADGRTRISAIVAAVRPTRRSAPRRARNALLADEGGRQRSAAGRDRRVAARRWSRTVDATVLALVSTVTVLAWAPTSALLVAPAVTALWLVVLAAARTSSRSVALPAAAEAGRIAQAAGVVFIALSVAHLVAPSPALLAELAAVPMGLVLLLLSGAAMRMRLARLRRRGDALPVALLTGTAAEVQELLRSLAQDRTPQYRIAGVLCADGPASIDVAGASHRVLGAPCDAVATARALRVDTVIVAGRPDGEPRHLQRLSRELEGTGADLAVATGITDVAGARLALTHAGDTTILHIETARFDGIRHGLKRAMDVVLGVVALIPVLVVAPLIALAIRLDSPGPVLFRQNRIGRDGSSFRMVKFRTMCADAEARQNALEAHNDGSGPLFKLRDDPRVTRVGALLRKLSLDELPQFWNVLRGDMSIVGPRPPLAREAAAYRGAESRRLLVKPGITGPWQVGGRSDLSWDDSVRLDLSYVENWSLAHDLHIMWRTAAVMLAPKGAY